MAETYKAVSRIKLGNREYAEVGETVSKADLSDVDGDFDELVAARAVVTADEFKQLFPNFGDDSEIDNQPTGTPSNLQPVENTNLAAADDGKDAGTGDAKAAVKAGEATNDTKTGVVDNTKK